MSNYTAVVYENSAIGTIVLVVGTSDRDTVSQRAPAKKRSSKIFTINGFDQFTNSNRAGLL
jgi:hypothetical protein